MTVPSLDEMTIEEYANRLFQDWGVGRKGKDNGVLVLVAPAERKVRIEVGYGLEPILPDGLAGESIRTDFVPRFRAGDYSGGIQRGVRHVAAIIRRNETLPPEERRRLDRSTPDRPPTLVTTAFFALFIGSGAFAVGAGLRARSWFPVLWGGIFAGVPSAIASIPALNASLSVLAAIAFGMFVWGYRKGRSGAAGGPSSWMTEDNRISSSSESSGAPSDSGSLDSFGGGSSGGGGASGS